MDNEQRGAMILAGYTFLCLFLVAICGTGAFILHRMVR